MYILVAEDQPDTRDSLKMLLEMRGDSVKVAANGEEAVNIALQSPPDVILMDLQMPVMDGLTATRILRERPQTQHVAIIGLSAFLGEPRWQAEALKAGCVQCLSKPLEWSRFENLLARLHIEVGRSRCPASGVRKVIVKTEDPSGS